MFPGVEGQGEMSGSTKGASSPPPKRDSFWKRMFSPIFRSNKYIFWNSFYDILPLGKGSNGSSGMFSPPIESVTTKQRLENVHVLYCTVHYCTLLHCIILYYTILYCTLLHCIILYCTVLHCTVLYCTVLFCIVLYYILLYLNTVIVHCTITLQYHNTLFYTFLLRLIFLIPVDTEKVK